MPGAKRTAAAISGARLAASAAARAGQVVREARKRRRLTQATLARRLGISRARIAAIEAGGGGGAPAETWFAIAQGLGLFFKFEFARDPLQELVDAGHLAMQELVIRLAKAAGWEVQFEAESRSWGVGRSIDVRLIDRGRRAIVIVECWNTFGNVGGAARSSNAKVSQALEQAVAIAGDRDPFTVNVVWVIRDTQANRELLARYAHVFAAKLPGPSAAWVAAVTTDAPVPERPGLIWSDVNATRLFARRRGRGAR